jgi:hypothetical protein
MPPDSKANLVASLFGSDAWTKYVVDIVFKINDGDLRFAFYFDGANNAYIVEINTTLSPAIIVFYKLVAGAPILLTWAFTTYYTGHTGRLEVLCLDSSRFEVRVDGESVFIFADPTFSSGTVYIQHVGGTLDAKIKWVRLYQRPADRRIL